MLNLLRSSSSLPAVFMAVCSLSLAATQANAEEEKLVIVEGSQVSFNYTLTSNGEEIESNKGQEPLTYTQGGGQILPALEAELAGLAVGDTKEVSLEAADAYGEVNQEAIEDIPLDRIPEEARFEGAMLQAEGVPTPIRVTEVREQVVVVDFNHPMAGKDLVFDVEIVAVEAPAAN